MTTARALLVAAMTHPMVQHGYDAWKTTPPDPEPAPALDDPFYRADAIKVALTDPDFCDIDADDLAQLLGATPDGAHALLEALRRAHAAAIERMADARDPRLERIADSIRHAQKEAA